MVLYPSLRMTLKQRLTVASVWAFEDIGVQELTEGLDKALPDSDRAIEYDKKDDVSRVRSRPTVPSD